MPPHNAYSVSLDPLWIQGGGHIVTGS